jgi:hypothetical protein
LEPKAVEARLLDAADRVDSSGPTPAGASPFPVEAPATLAEPVVALPPTGASEATSSCAAGVPHTLQYPASIVPEHPGWRHGVPSGTAPADVATDVPPAAPPAAEPGAPADAEEAEGAESGSDVPAAMPHTSQ